MKFHFAKDDAIKGPMLQYELRILRHWKCPKCARTVRTRGNVASRACSCSQPDTFMELIDMPATPAFDASAFTTYDNEVDSTPTERELVEELPAHLMPPPIDTENIKPTFRRGTGYLRAEPTPDEATDKEPTEADAFGAGLEPAEATADAPAMRQSESGTAPNEAVDTADQSEHAVTDGDKANSGERKRRRRRKRKPRDTNAADSSENTSLESTGEDVTASAVSPPPPTESTETETNDEAPESAEAASSDVESGEAADSSGEAPKKKRRRRRRRGK